MGAPGAVAGGAELHSGREGSLGLAEPVLKSLLRLVGHRYSILAGWVFTAPISILQIDRRGSRLLIRALTMRFANGFIRDRTCFEL